MKFHTLQEKVIEWADDRGIFEHSMPKSQLLKAMSEMGELCDAEIKGDVEMVVDGIGDVMVCLIIYAAMKGEDIESCLEAAYDVIKNRKGKMVEGGAFVKDE